MVHSFRGIVLCGYADRQRGITTLMSSLISYHIIFHWCAHHGGPQTVRSGDDGGACYPEGALCRSLSRISVVVKFGVCAGEEPFAKAKK